VKVSTAIMKSVAAKVDWLMERGRFFDQAKAAAAEKLVARAIPPPPAFMRLENQCPVAAQR
jgi:hypothetical protein